MGATASRPSATAPCGPAAGRAPTTASAPSPRRGGEGLQHLSHPQRHAAVLRRAVRGGQRASPQQVQRHPQRGHLLRLRRWVPPPPALSSAWAPGPAGATGTGGCCVGDQPGGPAERSMKQGGARGGARACARGGLWWCVQRVPCGPGRGLEGSGLLAARRLGPLRCVRRRTRAHASPSAQFLTLLMASPGAKPKPAAPHALGAGP